MFSRSFSENWNERRPSASARAADPWSQPDSHFEAPLGTPRAARAYPAFPDTTHNYPGAPPPFRGSSSHDHWGPGPGVDAFVPQMGSYSADLPPGFVPNNPIGAGNNHPDFRQRPPTNSGSSWPQNSHANSYSTSYPPPQPPGVHFPPPSNWDLPEEPPVGLGTPYIAGYDPWGAPQSFFSNASHASISGGLFTNVRGDYNVNHYMDSTTTAVVEQHFREYCSMNAAYDSGERYSSAPRCAPGTREEVIQKIMDWIHSPSRHGVFWLNGLAGQGKSAIAQTIAEKLTDAQTGKSGMQLAQTELVASFFFSRSHDDRQKSASLVPTLAYQLRNLDPDLKTYINHTVGEDQAILHQPLSHQLQKLIVHPLLHYGALKPHVQKIILVDALDECNESSDILTHLLNTLFSHPRLFKLIITSRPESELRATFDYPAYSSFTTILSLIRFDANDDIREYLRQSLALVRKRKERTMTNIPEEWPAPVVLERLVAGSGGLFIYASCIVQFLAQESCHDPARRLTLLDTHMQTRTYTRISDSQYPTDDPNPYAPLDRLYTHVLSSVKGNLGMLNATLGTVITLFSESSSLTRKDFSSLMTYQKLEGNVDITPDMVTTILDQLYSVLQIPWDMNSAQPVKMYHKSLRDYLVDDSRSLGFYINIDMKHADMAEACFAIMEAEMKEPNLCKLGDDQRRLSNADIPDLQDLATTHISGALRYACREWWLHLLASKKSNEGARPRWMSQRRTGLQLDRGFDRFLRSFFLPWLECLSLLGDLSIALKAVEELSFAASSHLFDFASATDRNTPRGLPPFHPIRVTSDCSLFLRAFYPKIATHSQAVYLSALPSSPKESIIRLLNLNLLNSIAPSRDDIACETWAEFFTNMVGSNTRTTPQPASLSSRMPIAMSVHPPGIPPMMPPSMMEIPVLNIDKPMLPPVMSFPGVSQIPLEIMPRRPKLPSFEPPRTHLTPPPPRRAYSVPAPPRMPSMPNPVILAPPLLRPLDEVNSSASSSTSGDELIAIPRPRSRVPRRLSTLYSESVPSSPVSSTTPPRIQAPHLPSHEPLAPAADDSGSPVGPRLSLPAPSSYSPTHEEVSDDDEDYYSAEDTDEEGPPQESIRPPRIDPARASLGTSSSSTLGPDEGKRHVRVEMECTNCRQPLCIDVEVSHRTI